MVGSKTRASAEKSKTPDSARRPDPATQGHNTSVRRYGGVRPLPPCVLIRGRGSDANTVKMRTTKKPLFTGRVTIPQRAGHVKSFFAVFCVKFLIKLRSRRKIRPFAAENPLHSRERYDILQTKYIKSIMCFNFEKKAELIFSTWNLTVPV